MDQQNTTIADLENGLQSALESLRDLEKENRLPAELRPLLLLAPTDGASAHVSLRHRDKARRIRRGYGAQAFTQKEGGVWIVFEAPHQDWAETGVPRAADPLDEFLRALHDAEQEPQLSFVSLKWFRDTYLVRRGFSWALDSETPRRLLLESFERDLVHTTKVPNPRSPEHPVTALRLNRAHPDVVRLFEVPDAETLEEEAEIGQPGDL